MSFTTAADMIYAFRFLKLLTTSWDDTDAYKLGVIDGNGKVLKKPTTREEKNSYTIFIKLVFNIKRLLEKVPGGKTRLASYAAALFLIKEHTGMSEKRLAEMLEKFGYTMDDTNLQESWIINEEQLLPGRYKLIKDVASLETGEVIGRRGTYVSVIENCMPTDTIFNAHIYKVKHVNTHQMLYVSVGDIVR